MIVARELTKTYGTRTAVDGLSCTVDPGHVTGFLGLDRPTRGGITVDGHRHTDSPAPLREVGALLEARALHPGRTARDHLRWLAASNALPASRVDEVLGLVGLVGLESVAGQWVGRFSLGVGQRLGIAVALLAVAAWAFSRRDA